PSFTQVASEEAPPQSTTESTNLDQNDQTLTHTIATDPIEHSKLVASDIANDADDDRTVPLSTLNAATSSSDLEFELPVTQEQTTRPAAITNSSLDLTSYYDELKQMAFMLEHGKDADDYEGSVEESSYE